MSKVTYTKTQLRGFQLDELKALELYSKVEDKEWTKTALIDALLKVQSESTEEEKEETTEESVEESAEEVVEKKPVVFHRKRARGFNPMSFKKK